MLAELSENFNLQDKPSKVYSFLGDRVHVTETLAHKNEKSLPQSLLVSFI
jgi:hypothetical protein